LKKNQLDARAQCSLERLHAIMLSTLKAVDQVCRKHHLTYFLIDGTLLGAIRHGGFIPWDDDVDIAMPRQDFETFAAIAQRELGGDYFVQTPQTDPNYKLYYIPLKVRDNHSTLVEDYGQRYHQGVYVDVFPFDALSTDQRREMRQKRWIHLLDVAKGPLRKRGIPWQRFLARTALQLCGRLIPNRAIVNYIERVKSQNREKPSCGRYTYGFELPWEQVFEEAELFPTTEVSFEGERFCAPHDPQAVLRKLFGDYMQLPPEQQRRVHAKFFSDQRLF
jgi:lipopolysaccharide cholinephosphotransferase